MDGNSFHGICPLCHSSDVKPCLSGSHWSIWACRTCTNAWTVPPPGEVDYAAEDFHVRVQGDNPDSTSWRLEDLHPSWRQSIMMQVASLERTLAPGTRILEIGCGEGLLLRELARLGFQVAGVEPSVSASEAARRAGLAVETGFFPVVCPAGHFDAVVMSHVLEHLSDPRRILVAVEQAAAGGHALFVQTNWRGLIPRLYRRRWYAWVPTQHFWHFTPRGLEVLFQPLGWRTVEVEYSSLIHRENIATRIATLAPSWLDQFHLLALIRRAAPEGQQ